MWLLALIVGCGESGEIDFPARLGPLEDTNKAPAVTPVGTEALNVVGGDGYVDEEGNEVFWAHARGYVAADIREVWTAAANPDVNVDRREADEWTVDHDTVPAFDPSYTIHNTVYDIIKVEYDITWVHELQEGSEDAPALVVAQWDKTGGSSVIDILRGSMVLRSVGAGVTEIELVEHLKAALRDEETIERYLQDLYDSIVAEAHGRPLPTY